MSKHDYALEVLRRELEDAQYQITVREMMMNEWKALVEGRRREGLYTGGAELEYRVNKEQYIMQRLHILQLKDSIETLEEAN